MFVFPLLGEKQRFKFRGVMSILYTHFICSNPFRSDPIGGSESILGCSFNSFYLFFIYLFFLKCQDPNPWPYPNGGSEPEPGLLRPFSFILSKHFIYIISF